MISDFLPTQHSIMRSLVSLEELKSSGRSSGVERVSRQRSLGMRQLPNLESTCTQWLWAGRDHHLRLRSHLVLLYLTFGVKEWIGKSRPGESWWCFYTSLSAAGPSGQLTRLADLLARFALPIHQAPCLPYVVSIVHTLISLNRMPSGSACQS